ncbi:MAG: hypothetical protein FWE70_05610, partial [Oscillospiraceae bacterium]|nr:hypothetical protein [Oscillospiraceae bacterium]
VRCGLPILLRRLSIYEVIYFGNYLDAADNAEFMERLTALRDEGYRAEQRRKTARIGEHYSRERVLRLWVELYDRVGKERADRKAAGKGGMKAGGKAAGKAGRADR